MVDPIASQAQFIAQKALSGGLEALLKQGPLQGRVQSQQAGGKTNFVFNGRSYSLDVQGSNLKPGDAVLAKLVNGRLALELLSRSGDASAQQTATTAGRSIPTALANMGLNSPNVQMLAQALVQAGIPLDQNALKELAQVLPQLSSQQISTLSFLFGRGLPVNPAVVSVLTYLFGPKPRIEKSTNNVLSKLDGLDKQLSRKEEGGDSVLDASQRRRLREAHDALNRTIPSGNPENQEDLEEFLRNALASPEALIQQNLTGQIASFSEAVVQLLTLLMELWPFFENSQYASLFRSLMEEVKTLHETLSVQSIQNLPPQSNEGYHPFFIQIPIDENGKKKQLELKYTPKGKDKKSGNLDLRLDMSGLGPMRVSIQWDHPRVSVSLVVSSNEVRDFIQPLLDDLQEHLQQKGFQVQTLGVVVGEVSETLQPQEELTNSPINGFDIRA